MSNMSNEPMVPAGDSEMSLVDTWMAAFTKPNEGTFARIAAQSRASITTAFIWVFVASLFTSFASLIAQAVVGAGQLGSLRQFLPPEFARELPVGGTPSIGFVTVICGTPFGALFAVIGFAIGVALIQWIAKLFGGTGSFEKLAYSFSTITVPYSVVAGVLTLVGMIPIIGILTGLISFALIIYVIVLEVLAVKAVNGLDTGKAAGAVLLPGLVIALLLCCCAIVAGVLLGSTIGDVFSGLGSF